MAHNHAHGHGHGHVHDLEGDNVEIRWITNVGIVINILLSAIKIIIGFWASSLALIADGIHSFSDLIADFAVLLGIHFGSKKADLDHPWGHGRFETFTAAAIAVVLIVLGGWMIIEAVAGIVHSRVTEASWAVLAVALISVVSKEWLYWAARAIAIRTNSSALLANAWHHRSDALSSVAVVLGFVALLAGYRFGDLVAAIIVGIMIVGVGGKIFNECLAEFAERAVDDEVLKEIEGIIESHKDIRQFHKLRTRTVGREIFLDLHILVDPALTIGQGHTIAEDLEEHLHHEIHLPVNILVHVEPDTPEIREIVKSL